MNQPDKQSKIETQLVQIGNDPSKQFGYVSPPIYRGSTAIYHSVKSMKETVADVTAMRFPKYGRLGSPNTHALESALAELEGGAGAVVTGTGLSAITTAILSLVQSGDHILVVDSVYWPTRHFCDSLKRFGIETQYYDPRIGNEVEHLLRSNTRLVYMESPGSMTFEVQDVPAISKICQQHNVKTLIDNTWATPLFFKPLNFGVDISIHSGTKYLAGHSDCFLGAIICNEATYSQVRHQALDLGQYVGPEDVFLGLRGLRTLSVRLKQHQQQALALAEWLQERPEVLEVLHPALTSSSDYKLWTRDFSGSSGLFSFILRPEFSLESIERMIEGLEFFGLGHSWGGFESLITIGDPSTYRLKESWKSRGALIRLHVGLENIEDLKRDLHNGFTNLKKI